MSLTLEAAMFGGTDLDRDFVVIEHKDGAHTFTQFMPQEKALEARDAHVVQIYGHDELGMPIDLKNVQVDSANGPKTAIVK